MKIQNITFACENPVELAQFWRDALGIPIHLDLHADDPDAEVERLVGLGAKVVEKTFHRIGAFTETWAVLRDPEGNGFCVQ